MQLHACFESDLICIGTVCLWGIWRARTHSKWIGLLCTSTLDKVRSSNDCVFKQRCLLMLKYECQDLAAFEYFSWEIWCENMIKKVLKANPDIQLITFNHAQLRWQCIFWGVFEILVSKTIVKDRSRKDHCKGLCLVFVCPLSNSLLSKDSSMKRPDLWREKCVPTKLIPMKGKMGKIGEKVSKNGKGGGLGVSIRFVLIDL